MCASRSSSPSQKRASIGASCALRLPLPPPSGLPLVYIADRMDIDDPLWGYQVRSEEQDWLQGYLTKLNQSAAPALVYPRCGKAGSSTIIGLLKHLAHQNDFFVLDAKKYNSSIISVSRPIRIAFVAHGIFHAVNARVRPVVWINVVREPIIRMSSSFYYRVSPTNRGMRRVNRTLQAMHLGARCDCSLYEFDECIRRSVTLNCSQNLEIPSQRFNFCTEAEWRNGRCTAAFAAERIDREFSFVGLTEELNLTVRLLERVLPSFFRGAMHVYNQRHHVRVTAFENELTGTTMAGAISNRARELILGHETTRAHNGEEMRFYDMVRRRFWQRAVTLLGADYPLDRRV